MVGYVQTTYTPASRILFKHYNLLISLYMTSLTINARFSAKLHSNRYVATPLTGTTALPAGGS